jgi:hypothetical protein
MLKKMTFFALRRQQQQILSTNTHRKMRKNCSEKYRKRGPFLFMKAERP